MNRNARHLAAAIGTLVGIALATPGRAACPPAGWDREALEALRGPEASAPDDAALQRLALELADCLASTDPVLRDRVGFELLAQWMRARVLSAETMRALGSRLRDVLTEAEDEAGFARPFAALVLAEVVRADRIEAYLGESLRHDIFGAAVTYLPSVRDYRGFDATDGWRHGVAHGADLLLQLAVHPALEDDDLHAILDAVVRQVTPSGEHFYVYGEGARLARPVLYVAARDVISSDAWKAWLERISDPGPFGEWSAVYASQAGLARRHNVLQFLRALFVYVEQANDAALRDRLHAPLLAAIKRIG